MFSTAWKNRIKKQDFAGQIYKKAERRRAQKLRRGRFLKSRTNLQKVGRLATLIWKSIFLYINSTYVMT
jgi:hypothetical protein